MHEHAPPTTSILRGIEPSRIPYSLELESADIGQILRISVSEQRTKVFRHQQRRPKALQLAAIRQTSFTTGPITVKSSLSSLPMLP